DRRHGQDDHPRDGDAASGPCSSVACAQGSPLETPASLSSAGIHGSRTSRGATSAPASPPCSGTPMSRSLLLPILAVASAWSTMDAGEACTAYIAAASACAAEAGVTPVRDHFCEAYEGVIHDETAQHLACQEAIFEAADCSEAAGYIQAQDDALDCSLTVL